MGSISKHATNTSTANYRPTILKILRWCKVVILYLIMISAQVADHNIALITCAKSGVQPMEREDPITRNLKCRTNSQWGKNDLALLHTSSSSHTAFQCCWVEFLQALYVNVRGFLFWFVSCLFFCLKQNKLKWNVPHGMLHGQSSLDTHLMSLGFKSQLHLIAELCGKSKPFVNLF